MSAFVCQPEHFGILAALAVTPDPVGRIAALSKWVHPDGVVLTAQRVARELAAENIRSVATRYPHDKDGDRPGPSGLTDAQILEAVAMWAGHYVTTGAASKINAGTRVKLCDCLSYQSCETDDWRATDAYLQLEEIRGSDDGTAPGYDQAPWGWYDDTAPHLDALIYAPD